MSIRFIHAADIHLDSPLTGLSAYAGAPVDLLRTATRRAFEGLVDTAISEDVDFMVIAGDLYDGTWKDFNTGLFFANQMARLRHADIRAVVLHGNHDAESEISARLRLPDNVRVFESRKPDTIALDDLRVALHGQSFRQRAVSDNLVKHYPEPRAGWLNIGVLHTALAGREGHESYAPCDVDDLRSRGYAYWALGHVHEHEVVCEAPWVVFPGNLQGRHARETGPRGAVLVTAEGDAVLSVSRVLADVLRWEHVRVDVEGCETLGEVLARADVALGRVESLADGRPVAARVTLHGRTAAHGELFGREQHVRAELQSKAFELGVDRVWIEKLRVDTTPAWSDDDLAARGDAVAELRAILHEAAEDPEFMSTLDKELGDMLLKLAPEVRASDDPLISAIREKRLRDVVEQVGPALVARVSGA